MNITRKTLTLYKICGIINHLICVRTNQSMLTGADNMIKNNIEVASCKKKDEGTLLESECLYNTVYCLT